MTTLDSDRGHIISHEATPEIFLEHLEGYYG